MIAPVQSILFTDGEMILPEIWPLCLSSICTQLRYNAIAAYKEDIEPYISDKHQWKSKPLHLEKSVENVGRIIELMEIKFNPDNRELLLLGTALHDFGRGLAAIKQEGIYTDRFDADLLELSLTKHGEATVILLNQWGLLKPLEKECPDAKTALEFVIANHDKTATLPLPDAGAPKLEKFKHLCLRLSRMADKFSTMTERTEYYFSEEGKKKEMAQVALLCEKKGLTFEGEGHRIDAQALEAFQQRKTFERTWCRNFVSYICCNYLAWIFDIQSVKLLEEVNKSGFFRLIFGYAREREIPKEQYNEILFIVTDYLAKFALIPRI